MKLRGCPRKLFTTFQGIWSDEPMSRCADFFASSFWSRGDQKRKYHVYLSYQVPTHAKEGHTLRFMNGVIYYHLGDPRVLEPWVTEKTPPIFQKRRWGRARKGSSPCGESLGQSQSLVKASSWGATRLLRISDGITPHVISHKKAMNGKTNPPGLFLDKNDHHASK